MNLTEFAHFFKRAVLVTILIFAGYTGIKIIWGIGRGILGISKPTGPTPQADFGKLPSPEIPSLALAPGSQPTFRLATAELTLPQFPEKIPVFATVATPPTPEATQKLAESLGFKGEGENLSESQRIWKGNDSYQVLIVNLTTGGITLKPNPILILAKLPRGQILNEEDAAVTALSFLKTKDLLTATEADTAETKITLLRFDKVALRGAASLKESQLARVDIFKTLTLGEATYPIYGLDPTRSYLQVFVAPPSSVKTKTPIVNALNWQPNYQKSSPYPLEDIETAWEKIKAGQGFITHLKPETADPYDPYQPLSLKEVKIETIELAYLHPTNPNDYFQPIYVFGGTAITDQKEKAQIILYLPALAPEWLE